MPISREILFHGVSGATSAFQTIRLTKKDQLIRDTLFTANYRDNK